jgi:histone H3/H4
MITLSSVKAIIMAKKSALAWKPVRDIMKSVGAQIVAKDAVDLMIVILADKAKALTTDALKLTQHSKIWIL